MIFFLFVVKLVSNIKVIEDIIVNKNIILFYLWLKNLNMKSYYILNFVFIFIK